MKYLIYIVIVLNLNSCKAQQNNKMEQKIIIPEINSKFEKFDIKKFQKYNLSRYDDFKDDTLIIYTGDKKDDLKKAGFSEAIYPIDSYFGIIKNYYKSGNIEIKGVKFNNGSEYGIWYEFNEEGKLIKEIDMDKGYDFGWKKIITYCEDKKIPLTKGFKEFDGFQTKVYKKEEENGGKTWVISYLLPVGNKIREITLDGKTGKEIKQRELDFIGG